MKPLRLFLAMMLISLLSESCLTSRELRKERKEWDFKNWNQAFKDRAFCLCQLQGYDNKKLEILLVQNDKSYYNPLAESIFDVSIKPQITRETAFIKSDSINSIGRYPEDLKSVLQKRTVLNRCLEFYNSKRLDSLAKSQRKYWNAIPSIMDKIHQTYPTY